MILCAISGHSWSNRNSNCLSNWSNRNLNLLNSWSWSWSSHRNLNLLDNGGGQRNWLSHGLSNDWCGAEGRKIFEKRKR